MRRLPLVPCSDCGVWTRHSTGLCLYCVATYALLNRALPTRRKEAPDVSENDIYEGPDVDPMAVCQNMLVEIEKLMGTYPNVPQPRPTPRTDG